MKRFHIYANGKRVKEISYDEYLKLSLSKTEYLLCSLHNGNISFSKGKNWIWIPITQLREILKQ